MQKQWFCLVCFTVLKILNEMTDTFTKILVPSRPIRSCLTSPESIRQHLEGSESFWKHLEASGSVRELVEASGNIWNLLRVLPVRGWGTYSEQLRGKILNENANTFTQILVPQLLRVPPPRGQTSLELLVLLATLVQKCETLFKNQYF